MYSLKKQCAKKSEEEAEAIHMEGHDIKKAPGHPGNRQRDGGIERERT